MRWSNRNRIRVIFIGVVAPVVLRGGSVRADCTFGTPTNLGPVVNSRYWDRDPCISADGMMLFFSSSRPGGFGDGDLWAASRTTINDPWGESVNLGPTVNTVHAEADPSISIDGLSLFFRSYRPGGYGRTDLWVTTRATRGSEWETPVNLGPNVNTAYDEGGPCISADGLSLYFCDYGYPKTAPRPGGYGGGDIWVTTRRIPSGPWGEPVNLGPLVNTAANEYAPSISADGQMLLFDSERLGGFGQFDLWMVARKTPEDPWGEPVNLGPNINDLADERDPSVSADGSTLYFGSNRPDGNGHWDIWQVSIEPIVNLSGDGIADSTKHLLRNEKDR
jgi:Tol biopolymer transport system component